MSSTRSEVPSTVPQKSGWLSALIRLRPRYLGSNRTRNVLQILGPSYVQLLVRSLHKICRRPPLSFTHGRVRPGAQEQLFDPRGSPAMATNPQSESAQISICCSRNIGQGMRNRPLGKLHHRSRPPRRVQIMYSFRGSASQRRIDKVRICVSSISRHGSASFGDSVSASAARGVHFSKAQ